MPPGSQILRIYLGFRKTIALIKLLFVGTYVFFFLFKVLDAAMA